MASFLKKSGGSSSNRVFLPSIVKPQQSRSSSSAKSSRFNLGNSNNEEEMLSLSGVAVSDRPASSSQSALRKNIAPSRPSSKGRSKNVISSSKIHQELTELEQTTVAAGGKDDNVLASIAPETDPEVEEKAIPRAGHVKFVPVREFADGNQTLEIISSTSTEPSAKTPNFEDSNHNDNIWNSFSASSISPWIEEDDRGDSAAPNTEDASSPKSKLLQFSAKWDSLYFGKDKDSDAVIRPRRAYSARMRPHSSSSHSIRKRRPSVSAKGRRKPNKL